MKKRFYDFLTAWEEWIFNLKQPAFVMLGKLFFSVGALVALIALFFIILDPDCHVVLNTTQTWSCVASHEEWEKVRHGKIKRWEYVTECDRYERKPGHGHDWSH
jgi:hypothetical protein